MVGISRIFTLTLIYNAGIRFTHGKSFCFLKFLIFHELMNQYQVCLYLFECISHVDPKYYVRFDIHDKELFISFKIMPYML